MDYVSLKRQAKAAMAGGWPMAIVATIIVLAISCIAGWVVVGSLIVGGPLMYGFYAYIEKQMDTRSDDLNLLFSGFKNRFLDTFLAGLVMQILVAVGFILLVVPGIILSCGLSMTYMIMLDNPQISGIDALKASWEMMKGHKWEYFVLGLSFLGWLLLCVITLGLASFYVIPYIYATNVAYYRRISAGYKG